MQLTNLVVFAEPYQPPAQVCLSCVSYTAPTNTGVTHSSTDSADAGPPNTGTTSSTDAANAGPAYVATTDYATNSGAYDMARPFSYSDCHSCAHSSCGLHIRQYLLECCLIRGHTLPVLLLPHNVNNACPTSFAHVG